MNKVCTKCVKRAPSSLHPPQDSPALPRPPTELHGTLCAGVFPEEAKSRWKKRFSIFVLRVWSAGFFRVILFFVFWGVFFFFPLPWYCFFSEGFLEHFFAPQGGPGGLLGDASPSLRPAAECFVFLIPPSTLERQNISFLSPWVLNDDFLRPSGTSGNSIFFFQVHRILNGNFFFFCGGLLTFFFNLYDFFVPSSGQTGVFTQAAVRASALTPARQHVQDVKKGSHVRPASGTSACEERNLPVWRHLVCYGERLVEQCVSMTGVEVAEFISVCR